VNYGVLFRIELIRTKAAPGLGIAFCIHNASYRCLLPDLDEGTAG
jgi:hypothetical protein